MRLAYIVKLLPEGEVKSITIYDGPDFFSLLEHMRDIQQDIEYRIGIACWIVGETIHKPHFDIINSKMIELPLERW